MTPLHSLPTRIFIIMTVENRYNNVYVVHVCRKEGREVKRQSAMCCVQIYKAEKINRLFVAAIAMLFS